MQLHDERNPEMRPIKHHPARLARAENPPVLVIGKRLVKPNLLAYQLRRSHSPAH